MINRFILTLILIFISPMAGATEPSFPIVNPTPAKFHLSDCTSDIECSFSGSRVINGKFIFGFDELCDVGEDDGCMNLQFIPDDLAELPHFDGWPLKSISIMNYKEAVQHLIGKDLMNKAIASGKNALVRIKTGQNAGQVLAVKGAAKLKLDEYKIEISCDSAHASANFLAVEGKSRTTMEKAVH